MLYPSIQELLTATAKDGEEKLNKYSVVMATAKCARMITNEYIEERHIAERKIAKAFCKILQEFELIAKVTERKEERHKNFNFLSKRKCEREVTAPHFNAE